MEKKIFGYVMMEINRLTNDEDLRQELWVFFLEGNSPFLLKKQLTRLRRHELEEHNNYIYLKTIKEHIWH